ncbi:MAG: oxidoreductase [Deltaproteobacteria bacterium]|nr:oxidoreductase [Deltaproteobacteria bacterium]
MKKLVLLALVMTTACQNDTRSLERRLDEMNKKLDKIAASGGGGGGAGAAAPRPQRPEPDRQKTYSVPVEGDPFDGPAAAKVTLVKAYDYACPYCEKVRDTMEELHKKYGGDLRVVYKQLVVHPRNAMAGALAFCAAGKQGKHKDMDRLLWDKGFKARAMDLSDGPPAAPGAEKVATPPQKCWDSPAGCANVVGFAQELQLNVEQFKADMKGACQQQVQGDMKALQQLGVSATPAFFVNGRFLSGAMPIENFVTLIDEELKKANERIQAGTPAASYYQSFVVDKGLKSLQPPG